MRILIDQDGVIADFEKSFYDAWYEKYPDEPIVSSEEKTKFYFSDEHPDKKSRIKEIYSAPGFYRSLPVIPGSIEAIKEMKDKGHDVFICTSPIASSKYCIPEKVEWIREHLGTDFVRRTIITKDKTLIKGDILIDDRPEIEGIAEPEWEFVVFDRPYNRHIKDRRRMTWDNWRDVIS